MKASEPPVFHVTAMRARRSIRFAAFAFASVTILAATELCAQDSTSRDPHQVQPERPTVATHAGTVARGWLEIEEGGEWDKANDGARSFLAPTNLKIGLAPNAQLNLMFNLIQDRLIRGGAVTPSDATVGIKYRFIEGNRLLGDFAVLPAVKLPTASTRGAGTGTTDVSLLLISSRQLGPLEMDLNIGQTRRTGNGTTAPRMSSLWTASFGTQLRGPLGATLEIFGYPRTTGPAGAKATVAILGGPTFLLRKWLALDAGVIAPFTGPQPHAVFSGFVWNVGSLR